MAHTPYISISRPVTYLVSHWTWLYWDAATGIIPVRFFLLRANSWLSCKSNLPPLATYRVFLPGSPVLTGSPDRLVGTSAS